MKNIKVKNQYAKGITLIALVITIIVLLILAAISIAAISGDNGVISNANEAEIKTGLSELQERISLYEIQTEGDITASNMKYYDKMVQEGIATKITTEENIKLAVIKNKDKLNLSSKLGNAGKDVPSNYTGKMTDLHDVYAIGLKDNEVYYIINGNIWGIQGVVNIDDLKEAELMVTAEFNGNGGTNGRSITKKMGEPLGTLPTSTRSGYTLNGWYTQKTGGEKITETTVMPRVDTTYYAQWTKDEPVITTASYTVKHYQQALDGSYPSTPTESQTLTGDVGSSVTPATKSYAGFTSPTTKTGTIASDGSTIIEYQYTRNSYTLTLNKNANIASVTGAGTYKYGQSVSITATLGSSTGYTHTWTNWTSSNTSLMGNQTQQNTTITMPAGNITFTANGNKTVNKYTATFDGNGGTNGTSITKNYGEQLGTLPTSTRTGYDLTGWYTATSGGTKISSTTTMPAQNITYYAQWEVVIPTISKNLKTIIGDANVTATKSITFSSTIPSGKTTSNCFDVSDGGNGSVLAWLDGTTLNIAANGKIYAPADSSGLFGTYDGVTGFTQATSIAFNGTLDTSNVTNMDSLFNECSSVTSLDLSTFDTQKVTNMKSMFSNCSSCTSFGISKFNTAKVTTMEFMFSYCTGITSLSLPNFITTSLTDMGNMFWGNWNWTSIDISSFDTSKVTNMHMLFSGGINLTSIKVGAGFKTSKVEKFQAMFGSLRNITSTAINQVLSKMTTESVNSTFQMFSDCVKVTNLNLSGFDLTTCQQTGYMFQNCTSLSSITGLDTINLSNASTVGSMFYNCTVLNDSFKIVGSGKSSYDNWYSDMFYNAGTSGSIYLYSDGTNASLVQNMVATKNNGRVYYGGVKN